ncbi:metal-dependent hydrolase [Halobaculum rarum]|uniref:metal-dependent hydrolase n=1 Tax=Halobaculum rarum TaxID=3075122 RepID=UPI003D699492
MDVLTHLFLPITVAYVVRPDLFPSPWYFALAVFAVLPDFDKLLGIPGLLHSVFTVGTIGLGVGLLERRFSGTTIYATVATVFLSSHLLLDLLDGGPVTFLYPIIETGVGLKNPTQIVFGDTVQDVAVHNPLQRVHTGATNSSREAYSLVNGYGILSALVFVTVYLGIESRRRYKDR